MSIVNIVVKFYNTKWLFVLGLRLIIILLYEWQYKMSCLRRILAISNS